jgi:hypothetical protein
MLREKILHATDGECRENSTEAVTIRGMSGIDLPKVFEKCQRTGHGTFQTACSTCVKKQIQLELYQATNLESQHIGPRHLCLLRHSSSSGKLKGTRTDQKSKTLQVTEHFALALLSLNITLPLVSLSTLPPRYSTLTNFSSHNRIAQVRSITMSEPLTIGDLLKKPCKAQEKSDGSEWLYSMEA